MTLVTRMETDEHMAEDYKSRPKVSRLPVTLRLLNENETEEAPDHWQESTNASRKSDTQFMLLLVTLFVLVNLTLITLLNQKDKHTAVAKTETPASTVAQSATLPLPATEAPSPVFAKPAVKQEVPIAIEKPLAPPAANAYVTAASPDSTKTIAAPYHSVSVSEHAAPQALAPAAGKTISPEAAKQDLLSVLTKD